MDVLSEVLRSVRLRGALYYNGEFSEPWGIKTPPSRVLAPYLPSGMGHVITYHLLVEGKAYARLEDGPVVWLDEGSIVVFPHGDSHVLGNGRCAQPVDAANELERIFSQGIKTSRMGGGGEISKLICGYMECDMEFAKVFLSGLPRILTVQIRNDTAGRWLENSILFSVGEAEAGRAGGEAVLSKLSEALLIETLRRYITQLPPEQTGWLAGVRDTHVGKALAFLHGKPSHPWTIAALAQAVGVSRSVMAERFRHYLDEPPMSYLTRWRLQLGAQMLSTTNHGVAQIALEVGYESEAAFNRAFKRGYGSPPAQFRAASKLSRSETPNSKLRSII
jgi:AraC-like DNA-binding protein